MRYTRQETLLGKTAQKKLEQSTIAVIGIGALGTVVSQLLARSGVNLILIDRDVVEKTNLQRQLLFSEKDLERSKAQVAHEKLHDINSSINIISHAIHLNSINSTVLHNADLIIDCTDNLATRFFLNEYCKHNNTPWVYGAAIQTKGYVMPIFPTGPCLNCFIKQASLETCQTAGVLNTITALVGSLQASLAMQILIGENVKPFLYHIDISNPTITKLAVKIKKNCGPCNGVFPHLENKEETLKTLHFCGSSRYQLHANFNDIQTKWKNFNTTIDQCTIRYKELTVFKDGRVLIQAKNTKEAQSLFSKYIGN